MYLVGAHCIGLDWIGVHTLHCKEYIGVQCIGVLYISEVVNIALHSNGYHCIRLHSSALHWVGSKYITLQWILVHKITFEYIKLGWIEVNCIEMDISALDYI